MTVTAPDYDVDARFRAYSTDPRVRAVGAALQDLDPLPEDPESFSWLVIDAALVVRMLDDYPKQPQEAVDVALHDSARLDDDPWPEMIDACIDAYRKARP